MGVHSPEQENDMCEITDMKEFSFSDDFLSSL